MLLKRSANVDKNRCVSCSACYNNCPRKAISIVHGCFAYSGHLEYLGILHTLQVLFQIGQQNLALVFTA